MRETKYIRDWYYLFWKNFVSKRGNQGTFFHLIFNKARKDAILTKNDDVIDLKFWNKFLPNANEPKQSTIYDSGGHSASVDMLLANVFRKRNFHHF